MKHGTRYQYNKGCKCPDCVEAYRAYGRNAYHRRQERITLGLVDIVNELPVLDGMPAGPWVAKAVCRGRSEWEMSENAMRSRNTRKHANTGIAIDGCNICPSLVECRTWVMSYRLDPCAFHVVAGMTPRQRNEERERAGIATPGRRYGGNAA